MFVLWNTTEGNNLRRRDFNIYKVNATSAKSLEPAGANASADATLNWFTPQYAGLALQAQRFLGKWAYQRIWLISFQKFKFDGISLDRNPTADWENHLTACVKDRVNFKVWAPLTIILAEPTRNATILIILLTFSHRVLVTPFMRQ